MTLTRTPGRLHSESFCHTHLLRQLLSLVATSDGTANSGSDYGTVNRRVTFRRGQTAARVSVRIINDTRSEPDETFMLSMSNPSSNTELSDIHQSETTIRDDDEPQFLGAVTNLNAVCVSGEITLSWNPPSTGTVNDYRYGIYADEFLVRNKLTSGITTENADHRRCHRHHTNVLCGGSSPRRCESQPGEVGWKPMVLFAQCLHRWCRSQTPA